MAEFAVGDRVRAIDQAGRHAPAEAEVIDVTGPYITIRYALPAPYWACPNLLDCFWRFTQWRAWDPQKRWQLQLVRVCAFCEHDISGIAEAHPILWGAEADPRDNWKCADPTLCRKRRAELDAMLGLEALGKIPLPGTIALEAG